MKVKFLLLILGVLLLCSCSEHLSNSYAILNEISGYTFDTSRSVALIYISPQTCYSCNMLIAPLADITRYEKIWGRNIFLVLSGVRTREVGDYRNIFANDGLSMKIINSKELYDAGLKLAGISYDGKPLLLVFSPQKVHPEVYYLHDDASYLIRLDQMAKTKNVD